MSATPSRLQAASGINTGFASSVAATLTTTQQSSTILVAVEYDAGAVSSGIRPTDTAGNLYYLIGQVNLAATFELEVWACLNEKQTASNVITCTDSNAGVDSICCAEEWLGLGGPAGLQTSASSTGNSGNLSSGALTTAQTVGVIWAAGVSAVGTNTITLGAGYSNLTRNNTSFSNLGIESQITTSNGAYTGTFTNTSASWACIALSIRAAHGGFPNYVSVGDGMSRSEAAS